MRSMIAATRLDVLQAQTCSLGLLSPLLPIQKSNQVSDVVLGTLSPEVQKPGNCTPVRLGWTDEPYRQGCLNDL